MVCLVIFSVQFPYALHPVSAEADLLKRWSRAVSARRWVWSRTVNEATDPNLVPSFSLEELSQVPRSGSGPRTASVVTLLSLQSVTDLCLILVSVTSTLREHWPVILWCFYLGFSGISSLLE